MQTSEGLVLIVYDCLKDITDYLNVSAEAKAKSGRVLYIC